MRCTANPDVGIEGEYKQNMQTFGPSKKVLVIGAGPSGLEAARTAAIKGHKVTIMDKKDKIGGKMHIAKMPPGKERLINRWAEYYKNEMERLNIKVELGKEVNMETVEEFQPDITIVAMGGKPLVPKSIQGANNKKILFPDDILLGLASVGNNVAIIGGSSLGVETADFILHNQQRKVTVFEMQYDVLLDISHDAKLALLDKFIKKDIDFVTSTDVVSIEENQGEFNLQIRRYGKPDVMTGFDTVILACGIVPNNQLGNDLKKKFENVFLIGDSAAPGDFRKAIRDAAVTCMKL
jgi:NADPH-dependent 2,4-dienoyl-CoA reductase/sulfur reductase-like enzyme